MNKLTTIIKISFNSQTKGIGFRQATALSNRLGPGDLYDDPSLFKKAVEDDLNDKSWEEIPFDVISKDSTVFNYMDALGLKFALPAVMNWSLSDSFIDKHGVLDSLVEMLVPSSKELATILCPVNDEEVTPEIWISYLKLSKQQTSVVASWLDEVFKKIGHYQPLERYEIQQLQSWKALITDSN